LQKTESIINPKILSIIFYFIVIDLVENVEFRVLVFPERTVPHEYHHTLRYRTVGFGDNLLGAIISEGLACHFTVEVCKINPPEYCVAYPDDMINEWMSNAEKVWINDQYDYTASSLFATEAESFISYMISK